MSLLKNNFLFILLAGQILFSQKSTISNLKSGSTRAVLRQAELIFDVYYSYSDSLVSDKHLTIQLKNITIREFQELLEIQNNI